MTNERFIEEEATQLCSLPQPKTTEFIRASLRRAIDFGWNEHEIEWKNELKEARAEGAREERRFILNILDGTDEADRQMGLPLSTKAIRFALASRSI